MSHEEISNQPGSDLLVSKKTKAYGTLELSLCKVGKTSK